MGGTGGKEVEEGKGGGRGMVEGEEWRRERNGGGGGI